MVPFVMVRVAGEKEYLSSFSMMFTWTSLDVPCAEDVGVAAEVAAVGAEAAAVGVGAEVAAVELCVAPPPHALRTSLLILSRNTNNKR